MSLFAFDFDFALLLLDFDLPDLADLPDFELFFELELFLLELLDFDFELEEERFGLADSAKGARAPKQTMAARGIANLIIFTTSKIRVWVADWLLMQPHRMRRVARKCVYGESRSIRHAPSASRV